MMIKARVERKGFRLDGRNRDIDSTVLVSKKIYDIYGPKGTGDLAFIKFRPDKTHNNDEVKATSGARILANDLNPPLDLADVTGSGQGGQVTKEDIYRYLRENCGG
jgi:pyruvate/2-oxoglutarate dehydrogenase complex dihydrolipoamide acyltransferase (E2) component